MRLLSYVALFAMLGAGFTMAYVMYRQTNTGTVTLHGSPEFVPTETGEMCGDVDLVVGARMLGLWSLPLEDGQMLRASFTVKGNVAADIGLRVLSPANRVVFFTPQRVHSEELELGPTIRGIYNFEFDNRHSVFTDKGVKVSVCLT